MTGCVAINEWSKQKWQIVIVFVFSVSEFVEFFLIFVVCNHDSSDSSSDTDSGMNNCFMFSHSQVTKPWNIQLYLRWSRVKRPTWLSHVSFHRKTANHLTDTGKQNSTGNYTNWIQLTNSKCKIQKNYPYSVAFYDTRLGNEIRFILQCPRAHLWQLVVEVMWQTWQNSCIVYTTVTTAKLCVYENIPIHRQNYLD